MIVIGAGLARTGTASLCQVKVFSVAATLPVLIEIRRALGFYNLDTE